ncbi:50S ribosomal protein L10 [Campylobacter pinnipediorum subsp. caledonicus]|uniref:Large ribosomal subunit protein uL10 n=1 Tax=Campylobacter pinnipediorum subsp. caledonicus TaxID=1874362 RepID=A0A1S6U928_9BACT|nr:50S ribosomal protein L10 [Campylobacter pinnipediorum]AQW86549.1 50S ribosomal protein L10 [Campylobacter pinnipediorum subsp. caledonicus]AQW88200.1 50S ribosomal protein L10 [Campylobacter pinnipediorum subsp. caledonicus]OPA71640.1 50S ribosomal protein L10 [Campylobacter pinnipediorum subsp. caledonicus]OPA79803.1 50S ribosomal protein L10 [Campylobacter pinnipediorum subsp. pinnipediorum]
MTRSKKSEVILGLENEFKEAQAIVVCDYRGLNVKKLEVLRNSAREQGVKVQVVKNTLANIALNNVNKDGLELKDTNIYVWGEDQLSVTKVVAKFEENNSDLFKIKLAHIDGEVADANKVRALSKMPSRDELIAMLLQVWNAPIQNFTIGLNALKEKKEQAV